MIQEIMSAFNLSDYKIKYESIVDYVSSNDDKYRPVLTLGFEDKLNVNSEHVSYSIGYCPCISVHF